jgi:hypothetical protein
MKLDKRVAGILFIIVLIVLFGFWFKGCLAVDKCLDGGGRWNNETNKCEHAAENKK